MKSIRNRVLMLFVGLALIICHVVRLAGVENLLDALFHQIHDMQ